MATTWLSAAFAVAATTVAAIAPSNASAQQNDATKSDWALRCFKADVCILQTGLLNEKREAVAVLALTHNPENALVFELRTPTGLLIAKGLRASVGSLQFRPTLITCLSKCLSSFDATKDVLAALKKGETLTVVYTEALTGAEIALPFSLRGFNTQLDEFLVRKSER